MLQVEYLKATYGEGTVLHNVSLEAKPGMVTCLVGRNGAGKSTTLRSIMGLIETPSGDILLDGKSIMKSPPYDRARAGIGYVPQGREIFPQLTVRENLLLGLEAGGRKLREIPEEIFETFPILKEFLETRKGEVVDMLDTLFDQEYAVAAYGSEEREEGRKEGMQEGIKRGKKEGMQEGRLEMLRNLMDTMGMDAKTALITLKIDGKEYDYYLSKLQ